MACGATLKRPLDFEHFMSPECAAKRVKRSPSPQMIIRDSPRSPTSQLEDILRDEMKNVVDNKVDAEKFPTSKSPLVDGGIINNQQHFSLRQIIFVFKKLLAEHRRLLVAKFEEELTEKLHEQYVNYAMCMRNEIQRYFCEAPSYISNNNREMSSTTSEQTTASLKTEKKSIHLLKRSEYIRFLFGYAKLEEPYDTPTVSSLRTRKRATDFDDIFRYFDTSAVSSHLGPESGFTFHTAFKDLLYGIKNGEIDIAEQALKRIDDNFVEEDADELLICCIETLNKVTDPSMCGFIQQLVENCTFSTRAVDQAVQSLMIYIQLKQYGECEAIFVQIFCILVSFNAGRSTTSDETVTLLLELLGSSGLSPVRAACLQTLVTIVINRDKPSSLDDLMKTEEDDLQDHLVKLLWKHTDDVSANVREACVDGLITLYQCGVRLDLERYDDAIKLSQDEEDKVQRHALHLLHIFGSMYSDEMVSIEDDQVQISMMNDAFSRVCYAMQAGHASVRLEAAKLLGKFNKVGNNFLEQTLSKKLLDSMRIMRKEKVELLTGSNQIVTSSTDRYNANYIPLMMSEACGAFVAAVRAASVKSMADLALKNTEFAQKCVDPLVDMFNDEIEEVRLNAMKSLATLCPYITISDEQLNFICQGLVDASPDAREAAREVLATCSLETCFGVKKAIVALEKNFNTYAEDGESICYCMQKLGQRLAGLVAPLTSEMLGLHPIFLYPESVLSNNFYTAKLIMVLNAASKFPTVQSLFPHHIWQQYEYLRASKPKLVPLIRPEVKPRLKMFHFEEEIDTFDEFFTSCRNLLEYSNNNTSLSQSREIFQILRKDLQRLEFIETEQKSKADALKRFVDLVDEFYSLILETESGTVILLSEHQFVEKMKKMFLNIFELKLLWKFEDETWRDTILNIEIQVAFLWAANMQFNAGIFPDSDDVVKPDQLCAADLISGALKIYDAPMYAIFEKMVQYDWHGMPLLTSPMADVLQLVKEQLPCLTVPVEEVMQKYAVIIKPVSFSQTVITFQAGFYTDMYVVADLHGFEQDDLKLVRIQITYPTKVDIRTPPLRSFHSFRPLLHHLRTKVAVNDRSWTEPAEISLQIVLVTDEFDNLPLGMRTITASRSVLVRLHPQPQQIRTHTIIGRPLPAKSIFDEFNFRNQYDGDVTIWSPQGRIHQIEYAVKAVNEGSATVSVKNKTHVRSPNELSGYQKKIYSLDEHLGISISGLLSDGRLLARFLHSECLNWRWTYGQPIPLSEITHRLELKMQVNTQRYGRRPFGVGLLIVGYDNFGPHIYQSCPSANVYDCKAMAMGARSQSARTYLEKHLSEIANTNLNSLIEHALIALRETLPNELSLSKKNTSLAVVGEGTPFIVYDDDAVEPFLQNIVNVPSSISGGRVEVGVDYRPLFLSGYHSLTTRKMDLVEKHAMESKLPNVYTEVKYPTCNQRYSTRNLLDLPDDVLLLICSYVSARSVLRLENTCVRLSRITGMFWRRMRSLKLMDLNLKEDLRVSMFFSYKYDFLLKKVIERVGPMLKHLDLSNFGSVGCVSPKINFQYAILEKCHNLESLCLNGEVVSMQWLEQLAQLTPSLKHLSMVKAIVRGRGPLDDSILFTVLRSWNCLETLNLRDNCQIRLVNVHQLPPTLRSLDISGCSVYIDDIMKILNYCKNLKSLALKFTGYFIYGMMWCKMDAIRRLRIDSSGFRVSERRLERSLAFHFDFLSSITVLSISGSLVTDSVLEKIVENLSSTLEELSIFDNFIYELESPVMTMIRLPKLKKVGTERNSYLAMEVIENCHKFENLLELDVSYTTNRWLIWGYLKSNTLKSLIVVGCVPQRKDHMYLRDDLLFQVKRNCPSLTRIVF
ncbi:Proteasome subunit alpha type-1 [Trichinella sp. T8]|nr:Proteasome subunit alpha type-1 [Trichinella sp. T8]